MPADTETPALLEGGDGGWTKIEPGCAYPPMEQPVMLSFDGSDITFGARIYADEGWFWGVKQYGSSVDPSRDAGWNDIEADDEYEPQYWRACPPTPAALARARTGAPA